MESLYASNWITEMLERQLQQQIESLSRLYNEAQDARGCRTESKRAIINLIRKAQRKTAELAQDIAEINAEIELANKLYHVDNPKHENKFFAFDEAGNITRITEQEYQAITPIDPTLEQDNT